MSVYGSKIQGIKKRVVKTLMSISFTVKERWPNAWALKKFFNNFNTNLDRKKGRGG